LQNFRKKRFGFLQNLRPTLKIKKIKKKKTINFDDQENVKIQLDWRSPPDPVAFCSKINDRDWGVSCNNER
jgi:hypothetical protein